MEKEFDELLRHALTPMDEPNYWLNQKIVNRVKEQKEMAGRKKGKLSTAIIIAAFVLCVSSVTVYAAWKYLTPSDVAEKMQNKKLADIFLEEHASAMNETQSYGSYGVTFLGIVSGELLSEYPYYDENGQIMADRTYAVVAIENSDGESMTDAFFASPLIGDYNPAIYNMTSMHGSYAKMTEDGIIYILLECDNVEIFADHDLYLCVSEGMFYNEEAYNYDEMTGKISRNEEFEGLNALFDLPVESSKANPQKAAEYLAGLGLESDIDKEKLYVELEESFAVEEKEENKSFEVEEKEENKTGAEVAEYALLFVGNPYAWGEDSLTEGTDCSGFTKSVYEHFEISLPRSSSKQRELGAEIETIEHAKPGDLVFYETPAHVAIYIGDGMVVHAMPEIGICVSEVDFDDISGIRRILDME